MTLSYGTAPSSPSAYEANSFDAFGDRYDAIIPSRANSANILMQTQVIYLISRNGAASEIEFQTETN